MRDRTPLPLVVKALALAACASCDVHVVHVTPPAPPVPVFEEVEPNDVAWQTPWLGLLAPGDVAVFVGHADALLDPHDGFRFTATQACRLRFELDGEGLVDFDLCLYDPWLDEVTDCFDSPFAHEQGTLVFDGDDTEFHLVVGALAGHGDYTLRIRVDPPDYALLGSAPAAADTPRADPDARAQAYADPLDS